MSSLLHVVDPVARIIATAVINALWEDAAIVFVVAALLRAWRGLTASTRYAAWFVALVAAIAVPILTTLSAHDSATTARHARPSFALRQSSVSLAMSGLIGNARQSGSSSVQPATSFDSPSLVQPHIAVSDAMALGIATLWALAMAVFLLRLLVGLTRLERLKHDALSLPVAHREALAHWDDVSQGGRHVRLCVSDRTEVPVAVGLFDSMVLIPQHLLGALSQEEIEQICLHEVAHLRRGDDWTNLLQRIASAVAWFSPGIYAIARGLDLEREVACDDDVIAKTGAVRPYAHCLTKMAEMAAWPHQPLAAPGAFVTRRGISERVERMLRAGRSAARGLSLTPTAAVLIVVAAMTLAMQSVSLTLVAPQVSAPPRIIHIPVMHVHVPATHVHVPATDVDVPATHVHVPATHVDVPATHVHIPAYRIDVPAVNVNVPAVNVDVPAISVRIPPIGVRIPRIRALRARGCTGCDFSNVNWSGRDLHGRTFVGSDFSGARLVRTNFSRGSFQGVDFSGADLRDANFRGASLQACDFSGADTRGADFTGARIEYCDVEGTTVP